MVGLHKLAEGVFPIYMLSLGEYTKKLNIIVQTFWDVSSNDSHLREQP